MLTDYLRAAMAKAKYEMLEDNEGFAATIAECPGVIGYGKTVEACRADLAGALESWILIGLWQRHDLPAIDGIDLNVRSLAEEEAA